MSIVRVKLLVFDKALNPLGVIDRFTSFFFRRSWSSPGYFEIHTDYFDRSLMRKENVILVQRIRRRGTRREVINDPATSGRIITVTDSRESGRSVTISGKGLLTLADERITIPPEGQSHQVLKGRHAYVLYKLVDSHMRTPEDYKRRFAQLATTETADNLYGRDFEFSTRLKPLLGELESICAESMLGQVINLDYKNKRYLYEVRMGRDLTSDQSENPRVIFSENRGNVLRHTVTDSDEHYKTTAYVAGQGEGADREIVTVGGDAFGIDRRELYVDARDVGPDGAAVSLEDRGKLKLAEHKSVLALESEVDGFSYLEDWNLGDFVTVINEDHGIKQDMQITEVQETYETAKATVEVTFGEPIKSVIKKIEATTNIPVIEHKDTKDFWTDETFKTDAKDGSVWIRTY